MRGVSRASFADLSERLAAENITSAAVATRLGDELFAVVGLLDTEHPLRRALADPGKPAAEKGAITGALLHGKVTGRTEALVVAAAEVPVGDLGRYGGRDRAGRDPGDGAGRRGGRHPG